ncbi:glycosyltransferase family 2 protein [Kocuria sp. HSID16901]|uniref:glycosyltransferase family 2 protein n=1 Tax=Kocuria sp. HSID16901 TaxID=2419505 RepID=UPI00065F999E|nr:glycosyltransferase family 2 protein [Kocuria sp. HSID16901]MCT1368034.1 glycosyltransferase [Rothia sp. p3-SID1597]
MSSGQHPRTSVIMPVYKTADRVVSSIESVLAQTDPDFELLVMIDGSPDHSSEVVADFLREHPDERVRVFDNPVNAGVSTVRNQALDAARGDWIAFIDSDDHFRPNFLSTMHAYARESEVDLVVCSHTLLSADGTQRDRRAGKPGIRTGREATLELLSDDVTPYVWDKLVSAEAIRDVRFHTEVTRAEDALFCVSAYANSRRVAIIPSSLYEYTVDAGSATWGKITPVAESDALVEEIRRVAGPFLTTPAGRNAYQASRILTYLNNAQQAIVLQGEEAQKVLETCRRRIQWSGIPAVLRVKPVFGLAGILLKVSPNIYRILYGAYIRRMYGL